MTPTGAALLAVFRGQIGKVRYVWGGSNPSTGADCSGLLNWDVNRVLRMAIPGYPRPGSFPGTPTHGPVVSDWLATDLCVTVSAADAAPGDLVIFGPDEHIGVYAGGGQMVSALNPGLGVAQTPVGATAAGAVTYRRIRALPGAAVLTTTAAAVTGQQQGSPVPVIPLLAAAALVVVLAAAALGAAAAVAGAATGGRAGTVRAARIPA